MSLKRVSFVLLAMMPSCHSGHRAPPPTESVGSDRNLVVFRRHCGTNNIPRPANHSAPMCWVPAGEFTMGTPVDPARPEDGPARVVRLTRGFWLDQFEVTNEEFARFLRVNGRRCGESECYMPFVFAPIELESGRFDVSEDKHRHPVTATKHGASAYCAWAGKRLPTEAEWEYAARHDPQAGRDRLYPWGDSFRSNITNYAHVIDPTRAVLAAVGSFPEDRTAVGVFDMGGNHSEWVADCYAKVAVCEGACVDPVVLDGCETVCAYNNPHECTAAHVIRGGSKGDEPELLLAKIRRRADAEAPVGFRCAY